MVEQTAAATDDFYIGMSGVEEDDPTVQVEVPRKVVEAVRDACIKARNDALGVAFDPTLAVGLSHVIAMLNAGLEHKRQDELETTLGR